MRMYEYTQKSVVNELSGDQRIFVAKKIMQEVKKIAGEKGISEEMAYELYSKGLYGGDREI